MKKLMAFILAMMMLGTLTACSDDSLSEEDILGTWVTGNSYGTQNILYEFEYEDGEYVCSGMTRSYGEEKYYVKVEYEIEDDTLIIYGDYGKVEYEILLKDGDLYLDDMRFKKMD